MSDNPMLDARPAPQFLNANGIKTHYFESGTGVPTILLHGGGAGADGWANWRTSIPLFDKSVRTICMDLVGFGLSEKPDPEHYDYSQDDRDNQLAGFIEALDAGPVNLIGNSTGGLTALGAAILKPDLVNKVVLMGSAGVETGVNEPLKALTEYDFTVAGMRRIISSLANPNFPIEEELITYRHILSNEPEVRKGYTAFMSKVKADRGLHRSDEFLSRLKHKTLIVHGKDDAVVPLSSGLRLLELIENSTGYLMPHCGHWAMMEYPETFARVALDFLLND